MILQFRRDRCLSAPSPVSLGSPRALGLVPLRGVQESYCLCWNHTDLCSQTGTQNSDSSQHSSEAEKSRSLEDTLIFILHASSFLLLNSKKFWQGSARERAACKFCKHITIYDWLACVTIMINYAIKLLRIN